MRDVHRVLHQPLAPHYVSGVLHREDGRLANDQGDCVSKHTVLAIAAIAAAFTCGCAMNDAGMHGTGAPLGASAAMAPGAADMSFVQTAAGNDLYEIEISRIAIGRAPDTAVKQYAQMLVNHHTATSNELTGILRAKGVTSPPPALPMDKQARIAQLSHLQGLEFQREYVRLSGVQDHQAAIGIFEQASRTLPDPELPNFATRSLPVLREHLRAAQDLAGRMAG